MSGDFNCYIKNASLARLASLHPTTSAEQTTRHAATFMEMLFKCVMKTLQVFIFTLIEIEKREKASSPFVYSV